MTAAALLWLAVGPGLALLLSVPWRAPSASRLVVGSLLVSLSLTTVVGLGLGMLGSFTLPRIVLVSLTTCVVSTVRHRIVTDTLRRLSFDKDLLLVAAVSIPLLALLAATPHWNFLVAPNLDAGNYEVYGNTLATEARFGLDVGDLRAQDVPDSWLDGGNTWYENDGSVWEPAYLYGYSVLLGVVKAGLGTYAGWLVNALLAAIASMLLALLARTYLEDRLLAGLVAVLSVSSFGYLLYSKQLMSEMLGLVAVAGVVWVLTDSQLRQQRWPGAVVLTSATVLALGSRLDAFQVLAVVAAAVLAASIDGDYNTEPGIYVGGVIGSLLGAGLMFWATAPGYYQGKGTVGRIIPSLSESALGAVSLFVPATGFIIACLGVAAVITRTMSAERPKWLRRNLDLLAWALSVALVLLALWALLLRWQGIDLRASHDAWNMVRLLLFFSPPLLLAAFLATPMAATQKGMLRWLPLGLAVALGLVVLRSQHSFADVWWVRRYIGVLPVVATILGAAFTAWTIRNRRVTTAFAVLAGLFGAYWLRHLAAQRTGFPAVALPWTKDIAAVLLLLAAASWIFARQRQIAVSASHGVAAVVLTVAMALEFGGAAPVLAAAQNDQLPSDYDTLLAQLPEEAVVVSVGDGRMLRGVSTTLRSLHDGPVLLNVPRPSTPQAVEAAQATEPGTQPVRLLAELPLENAGEQALCPIASVMFDFEWADDADDLIVGEWRDRPLEVIVHTIGRC